MAIRKQAAERAVVREDLLRLLEESKLHQVTEDELTEQRISFAFGNAMNIEKITKDSVRDTSQRIRLKA